jgi:replicative DNA helicase
MSDVITQLRKKEITPEQALEQTLLPGKHISEIECDLDVKPLQCGFYHLEENLYLRKNRPDLIIVAARSGVGKTAFAGQVALNVSKHSNVLFFSLEMTKEMLKERFVALETQKPLKRLVTLPKTVIDATNHTQSKYNLFIDDTRGLTINELVARAKRHHEKKPLDLVVVDYLQIVNCNEKRTKAEEVLYVAGALKDLAIALRVPVLALAQSNRAIDGRGMYVDYKSGEQKKATNVRPLMSDLADSAGIEKWSDVIMFLYRQYLEDRTRPGEADCYILKNRNGATEDFTMEFSGEICKFFDRGPMTGDGL